MTPGILTTEPLGLLQKQILFASLLPRLIDYIFEQGWAVTLGDGHVGARVGHMRSSLHYERLAQDLNLFIDGEYIRDGDHPAWSVIGSFWLNLHPLCSWGGTFRARDSNHFSLKHGGRM